MDELELIRRLRRNAEGSDVDPSAKERARELLHARIDEERVRRGSDPASGARVRPGTLPVPVDAPPAHAPPAHAPPAQAPRLGRRLVTIGVAAGLLFVAAWGLAYLNALRNQPAPIIEELPSVDPGPSPGALGDHTVETRQVTIHSGALRVADVVRPVEDGDWPIVVLLHATSTYGDRLVPLAETLASAGVVVLNTPWVDVPRNPTPEQFGNFPRHIACAVAYAHAQGRDLGGDPDRITVFGQADAGYGAAIAVTRELPPSEGCVVGSTGLPDTVVTFTAATRLVRDDGYIRNQVLGNDASMIAEHDIYEHLGGGLTTRFRLLHGTDDEFNTDRSGGNPLLPVPVTSVEEGERFLRALRDAGYEAQFTPIEKLGALAHAPSLPAVQEVLRIVVAEAYAAGPR